MWQPELATTTQKSVPCPNGRASVPRICPTVLKIESIAYCVCPTVPNPSYVGRGTKRRIAVSDFRKDAQKFRKAHRSGQSLKPRRLA